MTTRLRIPFDLAGVVSAPGARPAFVAFAVAGNIAAMLPKARF